MGQDAQGFVEVTGYVAAIEAADCMAKTANVKVVMAHKVDGPRVCVVCEGDVAACKAAVDAAAELCAPRQTLISCNVIARPEQGAAMLYTKLDEMKARKAAKKAQRLAGYGIGKKAAEPAAVNAAPGTKKRKPAAKK